MNYIHLLIVLTVIAQLILALEVSAQEHEYVAPVGNPDLPYDRSIQSEELLSIISEICTLIRVEEDHGRGTEPIDVIFMDSALTQELQKRRNPEKVRFRKTGNRDLARRTTVIIEYTRGVVRGEEALIYLYYYKSKSSMNRSRNMTYSDASRLVGGRIYRAFKIEEAWKVEDTGERYELKILTFSYN